VTTNGLFDAYLFVDWSARLRPDPVRPKDNAIWVGEGVREGGEFALRKEQYCRRRRECAEYLRGRVQEHLRHERRVLLGFDFAYGYPAGYVDALGLARGDRPWRTLWDELAQRVNISDPHEHEVMRTTASVSPPS
jgi:hypothetical protein